MTIRAVLRIVDARSAESKIDYAFHTCYVLQRPPVAEINVDGNMAMRLVYLGAQMCGGAVHSTQPTSRRHVSLPISQLPDPATSDMSPVSAISPNNPLPGDMSGDLEFVSVWEVDRTVAVMCDIETREALVGGRVVRVSMRWRARASMGRKRGKEYVRVRPISGEQMAWITANAASRARSRMEHPSTSFASSCQMLSCAR